MTDWGMPSAIRTATMTMTMTMIRSERVAAALLLAAAALGLVAANSPIGPALMRLQHARLPLAGTPLDLSVGHWISDGLLAIFFFVVAVELKNEFAVGQLNSFATAIRPAIAAACGVAVPALVYLAVTAGSGYARGWPVPTATDIAFALGVLAVFGKGIPSRLRIFILALAIIDDVVAIAIIAVFFTSDLHPVFLGLAVVGVVGFGLLSRLLGTRHRVVVAVLMAAVGLVTWALMSLSGVHATIAGVALGLVMTRVPALRTRHALEPIANGVILPLFAFSAALVAIPQVSPSHLSPPFWGILVALPVGKLLGIGLGGWLSRFVGPRGRHPAFTLHTLLAAGTLGGVGFTVSLLMNELAFRQDPGVADEGTLAVLLGSSVSIVAAAIVVATLARSSRPRLR